MSDNGTTGPTLNASNDLYDIRQFLYMYSISAEEWSDDDAPASSGMLPPPPPLRAAIPPAPPARTVAAATAAAPAAAPIVSSLLLFTPVQLVAAGAMVPMMAGAALVDDRPNRQFIVMFYDDAKRTIFAQVCRFDCTRHIQYTHFFHPQFLHCLAHCSR
jgi:hypothetical protein